MPATSPEIDPSARISPDARIHASERGTRIVIGAQTQVYDFVVIRAVGGDGDIVIGEHCYINPHCVLYSGAGIRFGNYVLVGPNCAIVPANHAIDRTDVVIRDRIGHRFDVSPLPIEHVSDADVAEVGNDQLEQ